MRNRIEIIEHNKPPLKNPVCVVDEELHPVLNDYELLKFFNMQSTCTLLIGPPRSGKSTFLNALFSTRKALRGKYSKIYLFCPNQSRASMISGAFNQVDEERIYNELSYENLSDVMDQIKDDCDPRYKTPIKSLIIFDDMGAYLRNHDTQLLFKELMFNRRHLRTSLMFACQSLISCEPEMRRLFENVMIFRLGKKALNEVFKETLEIDDKNLIENIRREVFDKKHNFLFINTESGRLFKNFDEIVISE